MDSDKILVISLAFLFLSHSLYFLFNFKCLSNGQQINYGRPFDLLQDKESILYDFVHKLGKNEEDRLFQIAKSHAINSNDNDSILDEFIDLDKEDDDKTTFKTFLNKKSSYSSKLCTKL